MRTSNSFFLVTPVTKARSCGAGEQCADGAAALRALPSACVLVTRCRSLDHARRCAPIEPRSAFAPISCGALGLAAA